MTRLVCFSRIEKRSRVKGNLVNFFRNGSEHVRLDKSFKQIVFVSVIFSFVYVTYVFRQWFLRDLRSLEFYVSLFFAFRFLGENNFKNFLEKIISLSSFRKDPKRKHERVENHIANIRMKLYLSLLNKNIILGFANGAASRFKIRSSEIPKKWGRPRQN